MGMLTKDIPKDYILERLEAILTIFAKMDGDLAGIVVGRANNRLIQRSSITYLFGPVQDILL